jgi:hypothetical protein
MCRYRRAMQAKIKVQGLPLGDTVGGPGCGSLHGCVNCSRGGYRHSRILDQTTRSASQEQRVPSLGTVPLIK